MEKAEGGRDQEQDTSDSPRRHEYEVCSILLNSEEVRQMGRGMF